MARDLAARREHGPRAKLVYQLQDSARRFEHRERRRAWRILDLRAAHRRWLREQGK